MSVQDSQTWEEVTDKVFNEYDYLLDESGVKVVYKHGYTGPGGDWDYYIVYISGLDSGERVDLAHDQNPSGMRTVDCNLEDLALELAEYIAESQGGELEADGTEYYVRF